MTIALVTAIIDATDTFKDVPEQSVPYTRLTFDKPEPGTEDLSPRNQALYFKTQIHTLADDDLFVWIDGKIQVLAPDFIQQCIDALGTNDIAILKHAERNCIYQEVTHIEREIKRGNVYNTVRYAHRPIREQVSYYNSLGYPSNAGLSDCSIFIVRGQTMKWVFDQWWECCAEKDWFDQTAIRFLCWMAYKEIAPIVFRAGSYKQVNHLK